jgi:DNA-binding transcriptional MerR regulator
MDEVLRVAEVSRRIGVSERWLRQAENNGKIPKAKRDINGWRVYTQEDVQAIKKLLVPSQEEAKVS